MFAPVLSASRFTDLSVVRSEHLVRPDYLGALPTDVLSDMFAWKEDVTAGNADVLSFNDGTGDLNGVPAHLCVVGTVLADRPYLQPHGNFQPAYNHSFSDAKLQFTVGSAGGALSGLGEDFDHAIKVIEALQHQGAVTPSHNHLIRFYRNRKGIRMSFPLFSPRNGPSADNDGTLRHPVTQEYVPLLESAAQTHALNTIPFYDHRNVRLGAAFLDQQMVGSVVEVWFSLHHWAVSKGGKNVSSDTFTARIAQVRVLRQANHRSAGSPFTNAALSTASVPSRAAATLALARARAGQTASPATPPAQRVPLTPPATPPQFQPVPVGSSLTPVASSMGAVPHQQSSPLASSSLLAGSSFGGFTSSSSMSAPSVDVSQAFTTAVPAGVESPVPVPAAAPAAQVPMVQGAVEGPPVPSVDATTGGCLTHVQSAGVPPVDVTAGGVPAHGEGAGVPSSDVTAEGSSAHADGMSAPSVATTVTAVLPSVLVVPSAAAAQVEGGASGALMQGATDVVCVPEEGSKAAGKRKAVGDVDPLAKRSRR